MRRFRWSALIVVVMLVAVACSSGGTSDTTTTQAGAATTTSGPGGATTSEAPTTTTGPSLEGQSFTFNGFGGTLQESQRTAWFDPFEEATGATVDETSDVAVDGIMEQVAAGNILVDVSELGPENVIPNCGELFEPIVDTVDRSAIDPALITNDCGVPVVKFAWILAYNADAYPNGGPTSTADFFDNENFPGKRGVFVWWPAGAMEAAMLASGKTVDSVYPIDMDMFIEQADGLGDDLVLIDGTQALVERLVAGDIDMAIVPSSRAYLAAVDFENIKPVFSGSLFAWDDLAITKGSPNLDASIAFLNYVAQPAAQQALTEVLPYGATTPASDPQLDDLAWSFYTENPDNREDGITMPIDYYGNEVPGLLDAWYAWATG